MKKLLTLILLLALTIVPNVSSCNHVHDEDCVFDEATKTGCTHEHSDDCGYIDPQFIYDPDDDEGWF